MKITLPFIEIGEVTTEEIEKDHLPRLFCIRFAKWLSFLGALGTVPLHFCSILGGLRVYLDHKNWRKVRCENPIFHTAPLRLEVPGLHLFEFMFWVNAPLVLGSAFWVIYDVFTSQRSLVVMWILAFVLNVLAVFSSVVNAQIRAAKETSDPTPEQKA